MSDEPVLTRIGYFGAFWDRLREDAVVAVATPVGEACIECDEPIQEGEQGLMRPGAVRTGDGDKYSLTSLPLHRECELTGILSHHAKACGCFEPGISRRESGRRTLAWTLAQPYEPVD